MAHVKRVRLLTVRWDRLLRADRLWMAIRPLEYRRLPIYKAPATFDDMAWRFFFCYRGGLSQLRHVLLLDIEMPDMNGHHVARELRKHGFLISILVLSACNDEYFIEEVLKGGVDGYVHKGETPEKIRQAVYHLSKKHSAWAVA